MFTKPPVGFEPTMSFLADLQNQYLNHSVHSGISKNFYLSLLSRTFDVRMFPKKFPVGIEPTTSSLPRKRSTAELRKHIYHDLKTDS